MSVINALIIDDEVEACENLSIMLQRHENICVLATAQTTAGAETLIALHRPQVIFLDIEMHEENAFRFLDRIAPVDPGIVFVTAYDEYAVRAFKVNAIDYILKPIDPDELARCVARLEEKYSTAGGVAPPAYPEAEQVVQQRQQQLVLRNLHHHEIVRFRDILYIEALGRYSKVFFFRDAVLKDLLISRSIAEYEEILPGDIFYRSHRSYLINCTHVKQIAKGAEENHVVFHKGNKLPVSRRRYADLMLFLRNNNFYG